MSAPMISVVMPAYNAERFVAAAVESVLLQTYPDFEFIIIDDGSTDGTLSILKNCASRDQRIRLISRPNTSLGLALNEALDQARGEFIARMDADDLSYPMRFKEQLDFLHRQTNVVAVGSQTLGIDAEGWPLGVSRRPLTHGGIVKQFLQGQGGGIAHPTAMVRRDKLELIGKYNADLVPVEDIDLFLRLAEVGHLANVDEVLLQYRVLPTSISSTRRGHQLKLGKMVADQMRRKLGIAPEASGIVLDRPWSYESHMLLASLHGRCWHTARKYLLRVLCDPKKATLNPRWWLSVLSGLLRRRRGRPDKFRKLHLADNCN